MIKLSTYVVLMRYKTLKDSIPKMGYKFLSVHILIELEKYLVYSKLLVQSSTDRKERAVYRRTMQSRNIANRINLYSLCTILQKQKFII